MMKIVTFNIRCDYGQDGNNDFVYRKDFIKEKIEKESPDVICFQEVLPHVAAWLREHLKGYAVIGCGREADLTGEQMTVAYKVDEWELMELSHFWLSPNTRMAGSRFEEQSECPRMCTEVIFRNYKTQEIYQVFNTHLDHISGTAIKLGVELLLKKIEEMTFNYAEDGKEKKTIPCILLGDFNAEPSSLEMKPMKEQKKLIDVTSQIAGTFHEFGALTELMKIDYIFISKELNCENVEVWDECYDGVYLSDHYPICATIKGK